MATGTLRIVLVALALALGAFVIARAFPSGTAAVSTTDTGNDEGDTPGGTPGNGEQADGDTTGDGQGDGTGEATGMDVRVLVSNGTNETDLAKTVAGFIEGLGYTNVDFGDADGNFAETTIYFKRDVREQAQQLRDDVFKRASLKSATADSDYEIQVVLGSDYVRT